MTHNDPHDATHRLDTRAQPSPLAGDGDERILQPGERIGRFRIGSVLGSGGMGEVYRAEQLEPVRRTVALKRLRRHRLDARQLAWFEIERQVLAQMQHPAIAQIFDAGTDAEGSPFFAMEYIEGESLLRYCELQRLGLRARIELLIRVCEGVQHAHQKGIIHRDLKPANILVATVDGRALPRIIDFGIATATSRSMAAGEGGEIVGTPDYMSPEQAGVSPYAVDLRSDVYALGVILYELLTGLRPSGTRDAGDATTLRPPSRALDTLQDQAAALAQRHGVSVSELRRRLRDDLDWIALKAIAPDREARYASVAALAEDLRCYLDDKPVSAAPGGRRYVFGKLARRHRLAIGAAAAVLLALVAGLALSLYGLWQADTQRRVAEARGKELEQVVAFQQATLKGIDIQAMGTGLVAAQRAQLDTLLTKDAARDATLAQFDAVTAKLAPTDLARTVLDRFVLAGALASIDRDFAQQPRLAADLRASAAEVYEAIGAYARSAELWRQVLDTRTRELGADAVPTLRAELGLGAAFNQAGNYAEARPLQESLYRRAADRADLPMDLRERVAADYALTLTDLGDPAAALAVQTTLLERITAERGERDPQALKVRNNLAISLVRSGRREEARTQFEAVLALRREVLGPNDPDLVASMTNVAAVRAMLGDLDGALALQQESYDANRKRFGDEHYSTLSAANNLASTLSRVGRLDEAQALLERAVETSKRVLGPSHPDTLRWMYNYGAVLSRNARYVEAIAMDREVVRLRTETLGAQHPDTIGAVSNLAGALADSEAWDEALPMAQAAYAGRATLLGEVHPDTIESRLQVARLQQESGHPERAVSDLRAAMALDVPERLHLDISVKLYEALVAVKDEDGAAALRRDVLDPFIARDTQGMDPALLARRRGVVETLAGDDGPRRTD